MYQPPLVSIICLCYNHEQFVQQCLDSIMAQRYKNFEIIIADDCSSDASVQRIEEWIDKRPFVTFIKNTTNQGNTTTFNQAAKHATGEYIMDLAADDALLPNAIDDLVFAYLQNPKAGIIYGNAELTDAENNHIGYYFDIDYHLHAVDPRLKDITFSRILSGEHIFCSVTALMNKKYFDQLGGYDTTLAYEDLDYWIRLGRKHPIIYIDHIITQRRTLSNSLSNEFHKGTQRAKQIAQSTLRICQKARQMCQNEQEFAALNRRVAYEIKKCFSQNFFLLGLQFTWEYVKNRRKYKHKYPIQES